MANSGTFIRNVQITGDEVDGDVYIAGMDEGGGGFPHNDTNLMFKSTDGGATWANTYTGSPFPAPASLLAASTPTSPACFPITVATSGTRAGVNLPPLTALFTWSIPSMVRAPTQATSITSALPTVVSPLARRSS